MEQQLSVGILRMADGQIREEGGGLIESRSLDHNGGNGAVNIGFAGNRNLLIRKDRIGQARHNAHGVLQRGPALDGNGVAAG
ncbi:hypothetical protein D3C76_1214430 [compost metagenome]